MTTTAGQATARDQASEAVAAPVGLRPAPGPPRWWRDTAGALTWASMLVVVALWVSGGGGQDLGSAAAGITSLGRLTGVVAADLLVVQVLLMARIPMVERSYGQDELARRHRLVGFTSFNLMVAHVVLITVGYAALDHAGILRELWVLVVTYPGMLIATAGTALLVLVTVTSIRRARRRLRYESWHLLHLYAYLGVGLALPHQLWTGQEFLTSSLATVYWWSLWIAAAGAILVWRIGFPLYRTVRHGLRVRAVVWESEDVLSVWMSGRHLHRLPIAAGQFFTWRFLGPGWTRGHPYSLSAAPTDTTLRITVKDLGDGSRQLADLRPGTRVVVEGPYGRLHRGVRTRRKVTLIAGGIGITPIRAILEDLPQRPGEVTLIYRAHDEDNVIFGDELSALAQRTGARLVIAPGHRIPGRNSWLPRDAAHLTDAAALLHLVPDIADQDVYICGATAWMDAVRQAALTVGVPATHIHQERFSW
jgi:predicted ferric reductase